MAREPIKKITLKSGEVRYRFVTDAPRGPDGKRRQVTHTFDTMREARDALVFRDALVGHVGVTLGGHDG